MQRTRAWNVVPVYYDFIEKYSTPNLLSEASIKEIEDVIYPLGLHWRATFLKNLGRQLEIKGGSIPTNFEELITLSGVGPYVASAWLCFHAGIRAVIIDANIVRFLCRFLGRPRDAETRRKKWINEIASLLTPPRAWKFYNYAILDFTMQICSKEPACTICPLTSLGCRYFEEISQKGN